MGRSNNQLRRTAKSQGKTFVPKKRKSKTYNQLRALHIRGNNAQKRKLAYKNVVSKGGAVKRRKFRSGGYNNSGKFGKAAGAKANSSSGSKKGSGSKK
ncbi:hypothetical protein LSM04_009557 [Trypanosoma melophagium]|uniref:uncharacterized protein n=1 Tax=Trypanosoma melophagium TaxID=715481 RepID=UPI00351A1800|nr:hypothetical protein LSM04_009557 [Trypanosoma melophagium]